MSINQNDTLVAPGQEREFLDACEAMLSRNGNADAPRRVVGVVQAFMEQPAKRYKAQIQAFTTKGDLPDVITNMPSMFTNRDNSDLGFEQVFREVPLDAGRDSWELVTMSDSFRFRKMAEGEQALIESLSGSKVTASIERYSAAIGWTDDMIRFRRLAQMLEQAEMARAAYLSGRANRYYSLLYAAIGASTTWQTTTVANTDPYYQAIRDIETLNTAAYALANANKDKGYGDTANMPVILFANKILAARLTRAFKLTMEKPTTEISWPIQVVYTFNSYMNNSTSTDCLMVLPGFKLQRHTKPVETYAKDEILSLTHIQAMHYYDGAVVADTDQVRKVSFA